jgi:hypothetical protein
VGLGEAEESENSWATAGKAANAKRQSRQANLFVVISMGTSLQKW